MLDSIDQTCIVMLIGQGNPNQDRSGSFAGPLDVFKSSNVIIWP